jgi:hypothetical protein
VSAKTQQVKVFKGEFQHPNFYAQLPLQMAAEREAFRYLYEKKTARHIDDDGLIPSRTEEGDEGSSASEWWGVEFWDYPQDEYTVAGASSAREMGYSMLAPFIFAAAMFNFGVTVGVVCRIYCRGIPRLPLFISTDELLQSESADFGNSHTCIGTYSESRAVVAPMNRNILTD